MTAPDDDSATGNPQQHPYIPEDEELELFIGEIRARRARAILAGRFREGSSGSLATDPFFNRIVLPEAGLRDHDYLIESDRPVAGPFIAGARTVAFRASVLALEPLVSRQEEINRNIIENLRMLAVMIEDLGQKIDRISPPEGGGKPPHTNPPRENTRQTER